MMKTTIFACITGFAIVSARPDPCPDGQVGTTVSERTGGGGGNDDGRDHQIIGYTNEQDFCKSKHLYNLAAFVQDSDRERRCTSTGNTVKRATRQDEMGPFWANRGKKDPTYKQDKLFAEEPHWVLMRRDDENILSYDPFFVTRGKKASIDTVHTDTADYSKFNSENANANLRRIFRERENIIRGRRSGVENMAGSKSGIRTWDFMKREADSDSEFFAARGKKGEEQDITY